MIIPYMLAMYTAKGVACTILHYSTHPVCIVRAIRERTRYHLEQN